MSRDWFCDLHTHSTASDGTDSPRELVSHASKQGIRILALTDHDNVNGVRELAALHSDVKIIPGVELSSRTAAQKCHILGLGIDPNHPAMANVLEKAKSLRHRKLEARIEAIQQFTEEIPEEEFALLRQIEGAGKPHLANLLLKYSVVADRPTAFRILNDIPTPPSRLDAEVSVKAVLASGGVPVWAHPMGEEGRILSFEQMKDVLPDLLELGIRGMECWYSKYPVELCEKLEKIAEEHHLFVSGGSDYHGKNKTVALGQLNSDGLPVNAARLTVVDALLK